MFSQDLVARTIEYFKETHAHEISPETAQAYLASLGGLFACFMNLKKNGESCKIK